MLDQQVVRAALKSYNKIFSDKSPSTDMLSPSSHYLRLLLKTSSGPPNLVNASWRNHSLVILLLEWRAAFIVQELAQHPSNPDASANQRVSKAVSEAFVAVQVGQMIAELKVADQEKRAISNLYLLVCNQCFETGEE